MCPSSGKRSKKGRGLLREPIKSVGVDPMNLVVVKRQPGHLFMGKKFGWTVGKVFIHIKEGSTVSEVTFHFSKGGNYAVITMTPSGL
jgi:hypothetical protein